ncbi:ankyrin repeat domain-containing protein [Lentisphaerota bacterium ZTH]|nr:ankyrin repeat domain-containing protein [Lentisphaerota bacterium]WET06014.1 ankyrin repeat domain-containing protein [Lentisphaerota bacterium ZTH]
MSSKYENLKNNIKDISENCNFGDYYTSLRLPQGLCFGMVFMWGQAVLSEDVHQYFSRLDLLTRKYSKSEKLSDIINKLTQKSKKRQSITYFDSMYLSILPFLDSLLLYHAPEKTSLYLDNIDHHMHQQNGVNSSRYALNNKLSTGNNRETATLTKIYDRPFLGTKSDYMSIINSLLGNVKKVNAPFFMALSIKDHTVGLSFINNYIYIYDANLMAGNIYYNKIKSSRIEQCVNALFTALFKGRYLAINIEVYLRPADVDNSLEVMDDIFLANLRKKIKDYATRRLWHWNHHHRARAKFTAGILKNIKSLKDIKRYLEEEKRLCEGRRVRQCKYQHYKGNRTTDNNGGKSNYYKIISRALTEIPLFLMKNENHKYLNHYLPAISSCRNSARNLLFYIACQAGHADVVRELLKSPVGINLNTCKSPPLYIASQNGHAEVVAELLKVTETDVNVTISNGATPLFTACYHGHIEVVRELLKSPRISSIKPMHGGAAPVDAALQNEHYNIVELLEHFSSSQQMASPVCTR